MADINDDGCEINLANLPASCAAVRKRGGIKKRVWITFLNAFDYTLDVSGYVDTVTMVSASPPKTIYQYQGRKFKHNGTLTGLVGENFNSITQLLNLLLYFYTPAERAAIEKLWNAEDVVIFIETEGGEGNGQIEVWGLDTGLNGSALAGGTGTALNDSTALTVTMSGPQDTLPKVLKPTGTTTLQQAIDYLNALTA